MNLTDKYKNPFKGRTFNEIRNLKIGNSIRVLEIDNEKVSSSITHTILSIDDCYVSKIGDQCGDCKTFGKMIMVFQNGERKNLCNCTIKKIDEPMWYSWQNMYSHYTIKSITCNGRVIHESSG